MTAPAIPLWKKISENLTNLPALIRLLNDRLREIVLWIRSVDPSLGSAAAMPGAGSYTKGAWVENTNPAVLGAPGTQYFVKGWKRLSTGSNHVLNADWLEARCLTGT